MKVDSNQTYAVATSIAALIVIFAMAALTLARPAAATAQFAKETGKSCGDCHTSVQGGRTAHTAR